MTMASLSSDTLEICRPFFIETGINAFSYSRFYADGTRAELWSDFQALEHTFFTARYVAGTYTPQYYGTSERHSLMREKVEAYPSELRDRFRQQLIDQREIFNHDHCLVTVNHNADFAEYFCFYMPRSMPGAASFYLNNIDRLDAFSQYYVNVGKKLICQADDFIIDNRATRNAPDARAPTTTDVTSPGLMRNGRESMRQQCRSEGEWALLTTREREIARLLLRGVVMREIAMSLGISPRTVERHVDNMKTKLNCYRKSDLISKLYLPF
ncbi:response regulator transcription factor [Pandoraea sputorum]|uniref:response regulator transcription factor n=1 Tax=Pandoraea sputorum TaxID=93222 RepID=UPI00124153C9|nr:helix-turn-helix transcriptional regulator [Pandoraea sputorum]VVE59036.1 Transcriptional regulatory protein UhpA [Pandoraea sputorum]